LPTERYCIDAGILALYFEGRVDVKAYFDKIWISKAQGFMCEVNLAEFMYTYTRHYGWEAAKTKMALVRKSKIETPIIDEGVTERAARLKVEYFDRLSLGDCFLVATALSLDSVVLTTEARLGDCKSVRIIHIPLKR
jgi:uncharacterized protein